MNEGERNVSVMKSARSIKSEISPEGKHEA